MSRTVGKDQGVSAVLLDSLGIQLIGEFVVAVSECDVALLLELIGEMRHGGLMKLSRLVAPIEDVKT